MTRVACWFVALLCCACSEGANATGAGEHGDQPGAGGSQGGSSGLGGSPGTAGNGTAGGSNIMLDGGGVGGSNMIAPDTGVQTMLPVLPALTNVRGVIRDDSVGIDFDPFDGAIDYRVYPLPKDQDIQVGKDGTLTILNAIYRCAGMRQTPDAKNNLNANKAGLFTSSGPQTKISTTPTLGYVYVTAADDRVPVYALGGYNRHLESGWQESRLKVYTTDAATRSGLVGKGWRDDGVVFYAPKAASASTQPVYGSQTLEVVAGQGWNKYYQYYFGQSGMAQHAKDSTPPAIAFQVLSTAAPDTQPLMAVEYLNDESHTELAVGKERFQRAGYQGNGPLWHVEWSGLTQETTLVVEALNAGCPFQGLLSPQHLEAPPHQTFFTLDELKTKSPTGEVFVNGQYDDNPKPQPLARSFIKVKPNTAKPTDWDFFQNFSGNEFSSVTKGAACPDQNCGRWQTPNWYIDAYSLDKPGGVMVVAFGQILGQFWEVFDDTGSDVTGKMRFTAKQKGAVDADANKFLHVTMSVDIVSTDRRYPQIIISDQDPPIQEALSKATNNTILVQPIQGPAMRVEAQAIHGLVSGKPWDVNNQAPSHQLVGEDEGFAVAATPSAPPFEHAGVDRSTKLDVYLSSQRLYLFFDDAPAGCVLIPSTVTLGGPVTVTFGDVLYHEGAADEMVCGQALPYGFLHRHQCTETKRHFDDVGFKSGVAVPAWNETLFPCRTYGDN